MDVIYIQHPLTVTKITFCQLANQKGGHALRERGNSEMHEVIDFVMKSISEVSAFAALQCNVRR
jgi:hypothetical protein